MTKIIDLISQLAFLVIRRLIQRVLFLVAALALLFVAPRFLPDAGSLTPSVGSASTFAWLEAFLLPIIIAFVVIAKLARTMKAQPKKRRPSGAFQMALAQLQQVRRTLPQLPQTRPATPATHAPVRETSVPQMPRVMPTPAPEPRLVAKATADVDAIIARTFGPNAQRFHKRAGQP